MPKRKKVNNTAKYTRLFSSRNLFGELGEGVHGRGRLVHHHDAAALALLNGQRHNVLEQRLREIVAARDLALQPPHGVPLAYNALDSYKTKK